MKDILFTLLKKCSDKKKILLILFFISLIGCLVDCSNKNDTVDKSLLMNLLYGKDNRIYYGWRIVPRSDYLLIYNDCEQRTLGTMRKDGTELILRQYYDSNDSIRFFSLVNDVSEISNYLKSNLTDYFNHPIIQGRDTLLYARLIFDNQSATIQIFQMDSAIYSEHFIDKNLLFLGEDWYIRVDKK